MEFEFKQDGEIYWTNFAPLVSILVLMEFEFKLYHPFLPNNICFVSILVLMEFEFKRF